MGGLTNGRFILASIGLGKRFTAERGICPQAELIQSQIMQFTTNQKDEKEMREQAEALKKTIAYFETWSLLRF